MNVLTHLGRQSLKNCHMLLVGLQSAQPLRKLVLIEVDFERFLLFVECFVLVGKIWKSNFSGPDAA